MMAESDLVSDSNLPGAQVRETVTDAALLIR